MRAHWAHEDNCTYAEGGNGLCLCVYVTGQVRPDLGASAWEGRSYDGGPGAISESRAFAGFAGAAVAFIALHSPKYE